MAAESGGADEATADTGMDRAGILRGEFFSVCRGGHSAELGAGAGICLRNFFALRRRDQFRIGPAGRGYLRGDAGSGGAFLQRDDQRVFPGVRGAANAWAGAEGLRGSVARAGGGAVSCLLDRVSKRGDPSAVGILHLDGGDGDGVVCGGKSRARNRRGASLEGRWPLGGKESREARGDPPGMTAGDSSGLGGGGARFVLNFGDFLAQIAGLIVEVLNIIRRDAAAEAGPYGIQRDVLRGSLLVDGT
jgi:hypothetical protein